MIDLGYFDDGENAASSVPGKLGKQAQKLPMTVQQARAEAWALLASGPSPTLFYLVDYLFVGGVLGAYQLEAVSPRTLRRYAQRRVLDRLSFSASEVTSRLAGLGIAVPARNETTSTLYTLGPVGVEIAKMRHEVTPATGFLAYTLQRVLHDVVTNEIVLRIARAAKEHGWRSKWTSKYQASLMKDNHQILEPDALLHLRGKDDEELFFLIEYHNEDKSTRALVKVRKYENARATGIWSETWQTDTFPSVLAIFRNKIVARGYQEGVDEQAQGGCQFYGRTLEGFLDDLEIWFDFNKNERGKVFPWTGAA